MSAILFDMDGVLYEGDRAVDGAADAISWCHRQQIPCLFLTNTTSRPRNALVEKLQGLHIAVTEDRVLTPPVAAARWLQANIPGGGPTALFVPELTRQEFTGLPLADPTTEDPVAAVVVGDLGKAWDFDTLNHAFRLLMNEPRPALIALGLTRYWRAEDGLRLDTGPYVKALEYATGVEAVVMGKPAAEFFATALSMLGSNAAGTLMVGDDIRVDIEAAQQAGLRTALVRTGKFRDADLDSGIAADAVLDSIAALPEWWNNHWNNGADRR